MPLRVPAGLAALALAIPLQAGAPQRPLPPVLPPFFDLGSQPVHLRFYHGAGQQPGTLWKADAHFNDGTVATNWSVPAGRTLVLTDFTFTYFLSQPVSQEQDGLMLVDYPNGDAAGLFPIQITPTQMFYCSTFHSVSGLTCTSASGLPLFNAFIAGTSPAFTTEELWVIGYLQ